MTEITNKQVAEALGWEEYLGSGKDVFWYSHSTGPIILPNFTDDLNAAWKYVWTEFIRLREKLGHPKDSLGNSLVAIKALNSKNPARYLCERFIKIKGGK